MKGHTIGIFGKLFGRNNSDGNGDYEDDEYLSEHDAEDIYLSSGEDEDYDFRDSYDDEDEHRIIGLLISADKTPSELLKEYQENHSPKVDLVYEWPDNFDDGLEHIFVCEEFDGWGVYANHELDEENDKIYSVVDFCFDCDGEGFKLLADEDAEDAKEHGRQFVKFR